MIDHDAQATAAIHYTQLTSGGIPAAEAILRITPTLAESVVSVRAAAARAAEVRDAIDGLDERERQIIVDHFFDGYTLAEIASRSQMPIGTVRTIYTRAKELLRKELS